MSDPKQDFEEQMKRNRELAANPKEALARKNPIKFTRASDIVMRRARWLWEGWLPLGVIALLAGLEDQGKSTWSLFFAARLTKGEVPGEFFGTPVSVAIQATEDDWAAIIKPRLSAADADMEKVLRVDTLVSLDRDAVAIGNFVKESGVKLIIFDPVITRLDSKKDANNYADVRNELEGLGTVLAECDCSVIGLTHFNKGTGPIENRIIGSRAWRAVVREVFLVTEDPENEGSRLLVHNKNNYGPKQKPMRFAIEEATVGIDPQDGKPIVAPSLVSKGWSTLTDVEIIAAIDEKHARTKETQKERCEGWLAKRLGRKPELSKIIKDEAAAAGFSESTVKRAAAFLGVKTHGGGPGATWRIEL